MEHSHHEDLLLFPRIRRFFPNLNMDADKEHERAHEQVQQMQDALDTYANSDKASVANMLNVMNMVLPVWGPEVEEHLRNEESTITVVARKYLPVEYQIEIVRELFAMTSAEKWRQIMPFVVNNLPHNVWKVRYVKAFLWANPLRAQEIGLNLYHSVDSITWLMLTREVPQIIPRGAAGHKRIY